MKLNQTHAMLVILAVAISVATAAASAPRSSASGAARVSIEGALQELYAPYIKGPITTDPNFLLDYYPLLVARGGRS